MINQSLIVGAISAPEILIVLAVIALLFGSTRIPKLARSLGQAQREFKEGQSEAKKEQSKDSSSKEQDK